MKVDFKRVHCQKLRPLRRVRGGRPFMKELFQDEFSSMTNVDW